MNHRKRLVADGSRGESYVERRHRTLVELKETVKRDPAVDIAHGIQQDDSRFRELDISLSPLILGLDCGDAGLQIAWRPRPDPMDAAYFVFHYHDSTGRDFGWHREPNPHVEGLEHYQERDSPNEDYKYESAHFESLSPVPLLWDIVGRIEERI